MIKLDTYKYPLASGMHVYKGIRYLAGTPQTHLENLDNLDIRPSDWLVVAYPKSGSHWVQEILGLIAERGNTELADSMTLAKRQPFLDNVFSTGIMHNIVGTNRILKTHFPVEVFPEKVFKNENKIVRITRNPKDVAVSYYHFYRMHSYLGNFTGGWDLFYKMFISGNVAYGSWFRWEKEWYESTKNNPNVLHVSYESMKQNPRGQIKKMATFLGKSLPDSIIDKICQRTSFQSMRDNPNTNYTQPAAQKVFDRKISPFMRKGTVGDWINHFSTSQSDQFDKLYEQEMKGSGLSVMLRSLNSKL